MFTGIIEEVGLIQHSEPIDGGRRLTVRAPEICTDLRIGDSVSVNGVCLTVIENLPDAFRMEAVGETLEKTNIGELAVGSLVNLERALAASGRFGGHIVQGHVNATGTIIDWYQRGENWFLVIEIPQRLRRYVILEGSIAIDGISLTIATLAENQVGINIIPHTAKVTNLKERQTGQRVNIEVDVLAKYVENLLAYQDKREVEPSS